MHLTKYLLLTVTIITSLSLHAASTWPGFQDQSTPLNTPSFTFTGSVPEMWTSNNNYYDGDFADFDGDGKIDLADPECVHPCDNDEGSFATGIPGDNVDACKQDCFFDGDSGMGNDGCEWNFK